MTKDIKAACERLTQNLADEEYQSWGQRADIQTLIDHATSRDHIGEVDVDAYMAEMRLSNRENALAHIRAVKKHSRKDEVLKQIRTAIADAIPFVGYGAHVPGILEELEKQLAALDALIEGE